MPPVLGKYHRCKCTGIKVGLSSCHTDHTDAHMLNGQAKQASKRIGTQSQP